MSTWLPFCVSKTQFSLLAIQLLSHYKLNIHRIPQGPFGGFSLSPLLLSSSLHGAPVIAAELLDITDWPCNRYAELFLFPPQGRIQIENGALSIAELNLSDSGMYQCVAENKYGIIYSSAQLMVLGKIASLPMLLSCLSVCAFDHQRRFLKTQQPAIALLSNQSADSFDVTMGSASKNMNLMECLILLSVVSSYWFRYYKRVAMWHCACCPM